MIIAFLIWSAVAVTFASIGIRCRTAKQPAGFFANVAPPAIGNVRAYNHAVSVLWFVSAAVFELLGIPFLFLKQNSPLFLFLVLGVVCWLIGIMIVYMKIETKHRK